MRRAATYAVVGLAVWLAFLLIAGVAYRDRAKERVAERVGQSMMATATVDHAKLALIRGHVELEGLHVRRTDGGALSLDIGTLRCELLPLGGSVIDHECRDLIIEKVRFEMSGAAAFQLRKPKHKPMRVGRIEIFDAVLAFMPTAFAPELGKVTIALDYVEAGPTTLKTPISWMFNLRALKATIDLPAGLTVKLAYADGALTATGSIFGATPVTIPVRLPTTNDADDARAEVAKLAELGKAIAEQLVERRAKDWLRSKLSL